MPSMGGGEQECLPDLMLCKVSEGALLGRKGDTALARVMTGTVSITVWGVFV